MMTPFGLTAQGIEQQFGVNHLGHFYLTQLLLPVLEQTAKEQQRTVTIVVVSSSAHYRTYHEGVKTSLAALNDPTHYHPHLAYGQSKLANVLFMRELSERLRGSSVLVNAVHPGVVSTELARYLLEQLPPVWSKFAEWWLGSSVNFLWQPDQAALTLIKNGTTGSYFHPIARPTAVNKRWGADLRLQKQLWQLSEQLVANI
eukprot:g29.t1